MFLKNMGGRYVVTIVIYSYWNAKVLAFMMCIVLIVYNVQHKPTVWIWDPQIGTYFHFIFFYTDTKKSWLFDRKHCIYCSKTKQLRDVRYCTAQKNTYVWHVVEFMSNFGVQSQSSSSSSPSCMFRDVVFLW